MKRLNLIFMKSLNCFFLVALVFCFFSCEKSEGKKEKKELSPPQWIQGEWEHDGIVYNVYFKFTSDDVIFALPYGSISSFYDLYEDGNYTIEETIKTNEIYEITVTRNQFKKISNFKKGDDRTHIQYYPIDTEIEGSLANDEIFILYKK